MTRKKSKLKKVVNHEVTNLNPRISLGLKISIIFLLIVGVSVAAFSNRALNLVETEIRNQTLEDIRADSEFLVSSIKLWMIRNESELLRITDSESSLVNPIKTYLINQQLQSDKDPIRKILEKSLFNTANYLDLVVMSPDSKEILIATNPNFEGKIGMGENGIPNTSKGKVNSPIFYSTDLDDYVMTIENPLKDETGKILAIIGVYINIHSLKPVLFSTTDKKQSGEIYVTTPTGYAMIRDFDINQGTIKYEPTKPKQIQEYINHEDKLVLGYYEFLPDLQVILLYEHEQSKLFAPLSELNRRIWAMAVLVFLISALISTFLIQYSLRPIKSLTKTALKIAEGNYKLRGTANSSDEIGVLNQVFNNMTDSLVSSLNEISYKNALLQSQYDVAPYGLASFNTKGELLSWNKTFVDVWKIPPTLIQKRESKKIINHCASHVKEPEDCFVAESSLHFQLLDLRRMR